MTVFIFVVDRLREFQRANRTRGILILASFVPLIIYLWTLAPGVLGFDSAELTTGAHTLGIVHPTGYPLYLLLAKLFTFLPFRSVAYRVNLLSAAFGMLTILLVFFITYRIARNLWASLYAGGALAFAYSFWEMSTVAEVYTLHTFFLILNLTLVDHWIKSSDDRWLSILAFSYGLSLTNHVSGILFAPGLLWIVLRFGAVRRLMKGLPRFAFLFLLGLAVYLYFPLRDASNSSLNYVRSYYGVDLSSFEGVWWMISGQAYRFFVFGYGATRYLNELISFTSLLIRNFTGVGVFTGLVGVFSLIKSRHHLGIGSTLIFLSNVIFFSGYAVLDKRTMFLPAFVIWSLWMAVGAMSLFRWVQKIPSVIDKEIRGLKPVLGIGLLGVVVLGCFYNWRWVDKSDTIEPETFARQVFTTVAPDSMVMGFWSSAVILEYHQQVEGLRPDLLIFNRSRYEVAEYYKRWKDNIPHHQAVSQIDALEKELVDTYTKAGKKVYSVEFNPSLARDYLYLPMGDLFLLEPMREINQ